MALFRFILIVANILIAAASVRSITHGSGNKGVSTRNLTLGICLMCISSATYISAVSP